LRFLLLINKNSTNLTLLGMTASTDDTAHGNHRIGNKQSSSPEPLGVAFWGQDGRCVDALGVLALHSEAEAATEATTVWLCFSVFLFHSKKTPLFVKQLKLSFETDTLESIGSMTSF
jgi:hypothetical protein